MITIHLFRLCFYELIVILFFFSFFFYFFPCFRFSFFSSCLFLFFSPGNAKDWINQSIGINRRYSESQSEDGYARSFSSSQGDNFEGLSDLIFRKRSQSITGENPVKEEVKQTMVMGPIM